MPPSLDSLVGNTPLVQLQKVISTDISSRVAIYAKLEQYNPSGSVKARAAARILQEAEEKKHQANLKRIANKMAQIQQGLPVEKEVVAEEKPVVKKAPAKKKTVSKKTTKKAPAKRGRPKKKS